ncbi:MAG: hypothetical protein IJY62_00190 [Clostridia bacterium]|nr:hypothetical protein [Clostridia bacterium]
MYTINFFDDNCLLKYTGFRRIYGKAEQAGEYNEHHSHSNGVVLKGTPLAPYVMYYAAIDENGGFRTSMATSEDGVHFKPLVNDIEFEGKKYPNEIIPLKEMTEFMDAVYLPNGKEGEKYILMGCYFDNPKVDCPDKIYVSEDGIHFRYKSTGYHKRGTEGIQTHYWNEEENCWSLLMRPYWGERYVMRIDTKNFENFSEPVLTQVPDSIDRPQTEIYGIAAKKMGDTYVGMMALYETAYENYGMKMHKYLGGSFEVQLVYSHDGKYFQRSLREPFIQSGFCGDPASGYILPFCIYERDEDYILSVAQTPVEHGKFKEKGAKLGFYSVKKGRFIGMRAYAGNGYMCTRPLLWHGGEAQINVQVPYGQIVCRVITDKDEPMEGYSFEECVPFTGDGLWTPTWKNGNTLGMLKDKAFALEFKCNNGIVWEIKGDCRVMGQIEMLKYVKTGVRPPEKRPY